MNISPVLTLDVGGRIFKVLRETISQYPDCTVARVISGKDPQNMIVIDNSFFFDRNPDYFSVILDFIRNRKWFIPSHLNIDQLVEECRYWNIPFSHSESKANSEAKPPLFSTDYQPSSMTPEPNRLHQKSAMLTSDYEPTLLNNAPEPTLLTNVPEPTLLTNAPEPTLLTNVPDPTLLTNAPEPTLLTNVPEPTLLTNAPEPTLLTNAPEPTLLTNAPEPTLLTNAPEPTLLTNVPEPTLLTNAPEPTLLTNAPEPTLLTNVPEPTLLTSIPVGKISGNSRNTGLLKTNPAVKRQPEPTLLVDQSGLMPKGKNAVPTQIVNDPTLIVNQPETTLAVDKSINKEDKKYEPTQILSTNPSLITNPNLSKSINTSSASDKLLNSSLIPLKNKLKDDILDLLDEDKPVKRHLPWENQEKSNKRLPKEKTNPKEKEMPKANTKAKEEITSNEKPKAKNNTKTSAKQKQTKKKREPVSYEDSVSAESYESSFIDDYSVEEDIGDKRSRKKGKKTPRRGTRRTRRNN